MPCNQPDCGQWKMGKDPYSAPADPDISGIGVLVAFGASSFFTLAFCTAYYLMDDNASTRPARRTVPEDENLVQRRMPNPVDRLFRTKVATLFTNAEDICSNRWSEALQSAVLLYSDQQSLTGIAILVSGFSQLRCSLATYHWQLTVDLAWFSSMTHLTTLTCLRHYFRQRPALRAWRLICMAITALLLAISLGSTGFIGPSTNPSFPALCLLRPYEHPNEHVGSELNYPVLGTNDPYDGWYISVTLSFLIISYLTRAIQLFPGITDLVNDRFRVWPRAIVQEGLEKVKDRANRSSLSLNRLQWAMVYTLLQSLWCIVEAMADLWSSLLWEITWLLTALIWGTIRIVADRQHGVNGSTGDINISDDDTWGFGQVVAVMLLLSPFVSFFELSYEALLRSNENLDSKQDAHFRTNPPQAIEALASDSMPPRNDNTAMDRNFQSIRFPRQRSTRRSNDSNQYQMISTPPANGEAETLQEVDHATVRMNVDQHSHADLETLAVRPTVTLYKYRWFRKLVLLIYCLSITLAGGVLYIFPLAGAIKALKGAGPLILPRYAKWLAANFGVIWIFAIVGVLTMDDRIRWVRPSELELLSRLDPFCGYLTPAARARASSIAWYGLILGLTGASAGFYAHLFDFRSGRT